MNMPGFTEEAAAAGRAPDAWPCSAEVFSRAVGIDPQNERR